MNDEELKALREELETFKKNLPQYATPEDMAKAIEGVEEKFEGVASKKDISELKEIAEKQGLAMQKMNERKNESASLKELLVAKKDEIAEVAQGGKMVTIKTDVTRSSVSNHVLAMRLPGVGQLASQRNVLQPLFAPGTVGPNSNGVIRYVDQAAITNNAAYVTEAAEKPEDAYTWAEFTLPIEVLATHIPVTNQALSDIDFIETEINNILLRNLAIKKDNALWNGSGTPPAIKGIYTYADEYVAAASGITDANIYDLIIKMQESIAGDTQYMPNFAVMNIADINLMRLKKDSNNNYVVPPFASQDGANVAGITIIASNSVTANTMLVGDFSFGTLYTLGGLQIDVGWIANQFIENQVTIRAEERHGLLVRSINEDAFAKETSISAALTTLAS